MKSILILSHAMELGGAEKSLLGLLNAIDSKKYQVDLFLMRHEGSLLEDIPENINLLPEIPAYTVLARPLKDVIKERHFILAFGRIVGKIKARSYEKKRNIIDSGVGLEYSHKYTVPYMPKIQKQKVYDMAISFLTPHYFVEQKVRAKKKIAWIHTDYSKVQINVESELKMWKKYDKIVSISDAVTESFLKVFPDLKDKIKEIDEKIRNHPKLKDTTLIEKKKKTYILIAWINWCFPILVCGGIAIYGFTNDITIKVDPIWAILFIALPLIIGCIFDVKSKRLK